MSITFPREFGSLQWFGRGPHENYMDRKNSAHVGLYESTVDEQYFPFILPVECGGKEDIRWFSLSNGMGTGIQMEGYEWLHFDTHRNSMEDFINARHTIDLYHRDSIFINIDHVHSGLGGDNGGCFCVCPA